MQGNERIPGAVQRWSGYRKHITEYILTNCSGKDRVLILGAGACDDINLVKLAKQVSLVCLADVNLHTMKAAMEQVQKAEPALVPKIHILETDFISISPKEYDAYNQAWKQGIHGLRQWWEGYEEKQQEASANRHDCPYNMLRDVWKYARNQELKAFDMVICLGLHSQLYIELALRIYRQSQGIDAVLRAEALDLIKKANERMAERFMEEVLQIGRRVILGLEYTTIFQDSEYQPEEISRQLTRYGAEGLRRLRLPRVEGAWQVEGQIARRYADRRLEIKDCQYLFWPFSEEKSYLMVIYMV